MNKRKVPKIRFKGFYDDWEQRKFGEVFMLLQNNTLSRAELNDEFGTVQNIHYGDVLIKYDEVLDVSKESLSYIEKQSIADKFKTSYLQNGDVIIADTAEDETVGKCTEIEGLTDQKVISGLHTMPIRPNRKFAAGFLGFYLNSAAYHDQLKPLMQGIKVTSISKGVMQDTVVKFPLDLKEQEQIGMYFSGLDHLITLHQRKLEKLKIIKKSMLENCFPENGEKVPKIRSSEFSDDWEQREFGDYNDLMTGYPFESDKFSEDGIKLVRGMNVKRGYLDFSEDICMRWNSCVGLENFLLKAGDILIQMDGALIGKSYAKIKENQLPALLVQRVTRSRTNNKFASQDFMYQTIQRDFLRYIEMSKTETAVPHLSLNDIRNFEIMVPCLVEQEKIGAYFSAFDRLITLHQSKLEKLKMIKKSMLETMFV